MSQIDDHLPALSRCKCIRGWSLLQKPLHLDFYPGSLHVEERPHDTLSCLLFPNCVITCSIVYRYFHKVLRYIHTQRALNSAQLFNPLENYLPRTTLWHQLVFNRGFPCLSLRPYPSSTLANSSLTFRCASRNLQLLQPQVTTTS